MPVKICSADELDVGEMKRVVIDGFPIAVVRDEDGGLHAIGDTCSHEEISLSEGFVEGRTVECWAHGAVFDLESGDALSLPATEPVPVFAVGVVDGDIIVDTDAAPGDGVPGDGTPGDDARPSTPTETQPMTTEPDADLIEKVEEALKDVIDPELGVDIVNLGLIYGYQWDPENRRLFIKATLTSAECGHQGIIGKQIAEAIKDIVPSHVVEWVWMPAWSPARVTEDGRDMMMALGFNV